MDIIVGVHNIKFTFISVTRSDQIFFRLTHTSMRLILKSVVNHGVNDNTVH